MPASGAATVITERGPSDEPEKRRRGTRGVSEVVRDGRTMLVLVKGLPAPTENVVVTTLGRGKKDRLRAQAPALQTEAELEFGVELTDAAISDVRDRLELADYAAYGTIERIAAFKEALRKARKPAQARKLRARLAKQRAKLERLNDTRLGLATRNELLGGWLKILEAALRDVSARECDDGIDNGDPEDGIADFGEGLDPGCVMRSDDDEADAPMPFTCPTSGASVDAVATINIAQGKVLERFVLDKLNPKPPLEREPVIDEPVVGETGGPYAAPLGLCGHNIDVTYAYRVYTAGTPFSLPDPPPGTYGLAVAVNAHNKGDPNNPGGQDVSLRLAAGTVR